MKSPLPAPPRRQGLNFVSNKCQEMGLSSLLVSTGRAPGLFFFAFLRFFAPVSSLFSTALHYDGFSSFFFAFFFVFFFGFLHFSLLSRRTRACNCNLQIRNFTLTLSAPTPSETSRILGTFQVSWRELGRAGFQSEKGGGPKARQLGAEFHSIGAAHVTKKL